VVIGLRRRLESPIRAGEGLNCSSRFHQLIGEKQALRGTPVADPFVIARASILNGTVVSEESPVKGKINIPGLFGVGNGKDSLVVIAPVKHVMLSAVVQFTQNFTS
jgi:hypothetical protein